MANRKKSGAKKTANKRKPSPAKKLARKKAPIRRKPKMAATAKRSSPLGRGRAAEFALGRPSRLDRKSSVRSGDSEGLPTAPRVDSESVEELADEGQAFEADVIDAVESAPDPDEGEIHTREVPEDDATEDGEP